MTCWENLRICYIWLVYCLWLLITLGYIDLIWHHWETFERHSHTSSRRLVLLGWVFTFLFDDLRQSFLDRLCPLLNLLLYWWSSIRRVVPVYHMVGIFQIVVWIFNLLLFYLAVTHLQALMHYSLRLPHLERIRWNNSRLENQRIAATAESWWVPRRILALRLLLLFGLLLPLLRH